MWKNSYSHVGHVEGIEKLLIHMIKRSMNCVQILVLTRMDHPENQLKATFGTSLKLEPFDHKHWAQVQCAQC